MVFHTHSRNRSSENDSKTYGSVTLSSLVEDTQNEISDSDNILVTSMGFENHKGGIC